MLHEDPLTDLFNRRYVLTRLGGLISGARRHGRPLSVAVIDVDHVKAVNDAHGRGEFELELTISVGWATWDGEESPDMLIKRADQALYEAKDSGRNSVRGGQNLSARLRRRI